jgi:hypothetical protein
MSLAKIWKISQYKWRFGCNNLEFCTSQMELGTAIKRLTMIILDCHSVPTSLGALGLLMAAYFKISIKVECGKYSMMLIQNATFHPLRLI